MRAAYDASGQPSKAALGFAKGQGIEVGQLEQIETDKGPRLGFTRHIPGRPAAEVLSELLPRLVTALPFPKTMRWGSYKVRYARPIHWFLALLDGQVIPFELTDIASGNRTYGHRFHAPQAVEVKDAADYLAKLAEARVIADRPAAPGLGQPRGGGRGGVSRRAAVARSRAHRGGHRPGGAARGLPGVL